MAEITSKADTNQYQTGAAAILLACILWGTTGTAASFTQAVSPLATGAFSMGVGGLLQALIASKIIAYQRRQLWQFRSALLCSALALAVYPLAFYTSMQLAGVAVGTVVSIASAPFFTVLIERLFGKGLGVCRRWWQSFATGALGIALLAGGGGRKRRCMRKVVAIICLASRLV